MSDEDDDSSSDCDFPQDQHGSRIPWVELYPDPPHKFDPLPGESEDDRKRRIGEQMYFTDDEEFLEQHQKYYYLLMEDCDDCICDDTFYDHRRKSNLYVTHLPPRLHACSRHSRAWVFFSEYWEMRNNLYAPIEADTNFKNWQPQNSHCRSRYLPRIDPAVCLSQLEEQDITKYLKPRPFWFGNHNYEYWHYQRAELESVGYFGPWNYQHYGFSDRPSDDSEKASIFSLYPFPHK